MKNNERIPYFLIFTIVKLAICDVELPDISTVEATIRDSFACRKNNPALSVSVVKDGKIVFADGYGVQSLEDKEPVTNTTLFGIASLTKAFTSTLLAKLTDRSREYSLNSRVAEFYGNNPVFDGYLRSKFATIRDLLSHRMGIPMHNFIRFDSKLTRRNLIRRLKELRPRGRFRDSFYYSNIMYGQAARLAEKIGKQKYEDLIADELFQPLGMTDSDFFTTANESSIELAQGYLDVYGELHPVPFELSRRWSELCGANCILSSAVDMAKWMMFHLSHGRNQDDRRVMSGDALEDTHRPENVLAKSSLSKYYTKPNVPETFSQTGYGLGWRTGHYRGYNMLTHTGSSWGYKNMISLFPDMNLGIYTAMTGDDEDFMFRYSIQQYLADVYMGLTPWLNSTLICTFPEPWLPAKPKRTKPSISKDLMPQRNLDDYLGLYENPAYGQIEIFILDEENSTNKLIAEYGYVDLILYPKSRLDEFFFETDGIAAMLINFGTIQFKTRNGEIDKMRIPSFEPKDPPIFRRVHKPPPRPADSIIENNTPADPKTSTDPISTVPEVSSAGTEGIKEKMPSDTSVDTGSAAKTNTGSVDNEQMTQPDGADIVNSVAENNAKTAPDNLSETQADTPNSQPDVAKQSTDQNAKTVAENPSLDKTVESKSTKTDTVPKSETSNNAVKPEATETTVESKSTKTDTAPKSETSNNAVKPEATETKPVVDSSKISADKASETKAGPENTGHTKDPEKGNPKPIE